jgi:RimJ/RimL family protein N-acetyltransferase
MEGVRLREARVEDAPRVIEFMTEMLNEPGLDLVFEEGEFQMSVEDEEKWIREHSERENSLILVAESVEGGEMVGLLSCTGWQRRANRHCTMLGISIKKGWRDRGVGREMMQAAVDWARASGVVKRVELEVFERNARGRHLYESLGFVQEGVRRHAFRKDGQWVDSVVMGLLIED